ncbi:unnamed protein product, partial [Mesorhabditis belari]|uniref:Uncharacterized protein n=1 Tax=Mesorhabditis belari TaxID=2138241 RepID=A0AAF3EKB8_9BILA
MNQNLGLGSAQFEKFKQFFEQQTSFPSSEVQSFADSWEHSSKEVHRLLEHAARARPHHTADTLSVNETESWIKHLVEPIFETCAHIQQKIQLLDEQRVELYKVESKYKKLRASKPRTVCEKCFTYEMIDGKQEPVNLTCHRSCALCEKDSTVSCPAFSRYGQCCPKCGCDVGDPKRIFLTTTKKIPRIENLIDEYQGEFDFVLKAMSTFSVFLQNNGITLKGNLFEKHLQKFILAEKKKHKRTDSDRLHQLNSLSISYQNVYITILREKKHKIGLEKLQDIRQKLFSLPHTGGNIAETFVSCIKGGHQDFAATVTKCEESTFQKWLGYAGSLKEGIFEVKPVAVFTRLITRPTEKETEMMLTA